MRNILRNPLTKQSSIPTVGFNMKRVQKGHVTLKWCVSPCAAFCTVVLHESSPFNIQVAGILAGSLVSVPCGNVTAAE